MAARSLKRMAGNRELKVGHMIVEFATPGIGQILAASERVDNADAIAAVDGVDCLWVGHFDLSSSLGIAGQIDHPDFHAAIDTVVKACKRRKKALGRLVPTVEVGVELYRQGHDFICYSGDVWALYEVVSTAFEGLRQGAAASGKTAGKGVGRGGKK